MKNNIVKVLITDPLSDAGISVLKDAGISIVYNTDAKKKELLDIVPEVDGWIIRSGSLIDKDLINAATKLQVIGRAGVGVDNIDIPIATEKGIIIMNTPDVNTISAAEHTIGIMLSLARNISIGSQRLNAGNWDRNNLIGTELRNKTIGIVGLGKIGREVMNRCLSFGMRVIGFDPYIKDNLFSPDDVTLTDLDTLTKESDFITLHVPKLDSTNNLFDLKRLKMMKSTAMIINVARGGIINEEDLSIAVKERTKEIGVRKALGATSISIVGLVVQESLALMFVSGCLGLVLGVGLLEVVSPFVDHEYFQNPQVDFRIALVALGVLSVVGVVSGIGPAIRAVSIRPVEALRDE